MKLAVFASGNGSNFQALVDVAKKGQLHAEIDCLVCDRPSAKVIERARIEGIESIVLEPKTFPTKVDYERAIRTEMERRGIELIVLAGYMRIVGETLLSAFEERMINLHPSLLPAFTGKDAIGDAYAYGVKLTGVTVHYVDQGMDTGPIIEQQTVRIESEDTLETLTERIHQAEHQLLPKVINRIAAKQVRLNGRKVTY